MGFSLIDYAVLAVYLVGITVFGILFRRTHHSVKDYFVGARNTHWIVISLSIVATETSAITFVSIPGIAYARGGNFAFLQLVMGYLIGRVVIVLLFIPAYFRKSLLTIYQLLRDRFGGGVKSLASILFIMMRTVADSVRLVLTSIVVAIVWTSFFPNLLSQNVFSLSASVICLAFPAISIISASSAWDRL